LNNEKLTKYT